MQHGHLENVPWHRHVDEYSIFLTLGGETGAEVARIVDDLLRRGGPTDGQRIQEMLDAYESAVSFDAEGARAARYRDARLRRVGAGR